MRATRLLRQECQEFLAKILDKKETETRLDDIQVVVEFLDVS